MKKKEIVRMLGLLTNIIFGLLTSLVRTTEVSSGLTSDRLSHSSLLFYFSVFLFPSGGPPPEISLLLSVLVMCPDPYSKVKVFQLKI